MLNARGMAYYNVKDLTNAESDLSRAIELNPRRGVHYLHRSFIHFAAGDKTRALSDANQARTHGASVDARYLSELQLP